MSILHPNRTIREVDQELVVKIPLPPAPVAIAATLTTGSSFRANWVHSPFADNYILYVSIDPTFATFIAGYNGKVISNLVNFHDLSGLGPVTHYYTVKARGAGGLSSASNTVNAALPVTFVHDTFVGASGTLLTAHVGEIGATWAALGGAVTLSGGNSIFNSDVGESWGVASGVPPSINYYVEGQCQMRSAMIGANDGVNLILRHAGGRRASIFFSNLAQQWQLYGPDDAIKGTSALDLVTTSFWPTVRLSAVGRLYTVYINSVQRIQWLDNADSAGPGSAAVRFFNVIAGSSSNSKLHVAAFKAEQL